ncbi:MAG TPA: DNA/RNA non-specific endonuclease, partial [Chitinophagaceae bacterium]|nr:DNA/RNA non-specific endonuclease [Chitinophagaceae bacterium]
MLISVEQLKESANRYKSGKDTKGLDKAIPDEVAKGNIDGSQDNLAKRLELIEAVAPEPAEFAFERAIGKNDSVYSNFVELITGTKQKVGRITIKSGSKNKGYATGFMVSERLLLTNWHVFNNETDVADSEVQFFYEYDIFGRPMPGVSFRLKATDFFHSFKPLDYCFVAVEPVDVTGTVALSSIGYIFLDPAAGKLGDEDIELLNIIHHPGGDYKQLSIRENKFTKIMATTLWYESDTAQGSSGSPVFNDQWQIVALHHMGVPDMTPDGKNYLDMDGKIIPAVNGKIDETRIHWIANEGIRISVILKDVFARFPDSAYVNGLKKQPSLFPGGSPMPDKNKAGGEQTTKNDNDMDTTNTSKVEISFPASMMDASGNVTISINNKNGTPVPVAEDRRVVQRIEDGLNEIKKVDKEKAIDFSACKGYLPGFMGVTIKLPQPQKALQKQIAKMSNGKTELKYFKYSVLFNEVTKMPAMSAINVEGNPALRLDNSKRSDDWLRDHRINIDAQLLDKFYAGSGFDKGHMSRFEDANWDASEAEAFRNGIYTCFYTNACPQVPDLNRGGGVWGKLEKAVLEKGVKKEAGKLGRITVFNGPIFSDTKNRKFREEIVPMEFFKIIVWRNDDNEVKATGFKLSQEDLVGSIKFTESFGILEEAI